MIGSLLVRENDNGHHHKFIIIITDAWVFTLDSA